MTRLLRISTDRIEPKRWWCVAIHPTVEALRDAGRRYRGFGPNVWTDIWGLCQPTSYRCNPDTGERRYPRNGFAGVIRLTDELLTAEVVAHELLHAAVATYRMNVAHCADLGDDCGEPEEALAYIYGELYASLEPQLHGS